MLSVGGENFKTYMESAQVPRRSLKKICKYKRVRWFSCWCIGGKQYIYTFVSPSGVEEQFHSIISGRQLGYFGSIVPCGCKCLSADDLGLCLATA